MSNLELSLSVGRLTDRVQALEKRVSENDLYIEILQNEFIRKRDATSPPTCESTENDIDWMWCYENPKDAAALIDRLHRMRRG